MRAVYLCALLDMANWDFFFQLSSGHFVLLHCFVFVFQF